MILAVAATIWLLRHKLKPLAAVVQQAQALGAGDLSVRLDVHSRDEIGQLADSFNRMGDALSGMVSRIRGASGEVSQRAQLLAGLSAAPMKAWSSSPARSPAWPVRWRNSAPPR